MWRLTLTQRFAFNVVVAMLIVALCLACQLALANDMRAFAVKMGDSSGSGWSGAVIGSTGRQYENYLIATCAHGWERGSDPYVIHEGTSQRIPATPIWVANKQDVDMALFSVPKRVQLPNIRVPAIPDRPPQVGEELFGWGYTRGGPAQPFSGRVSGALGKNLELTCNTQRGDSGSILWNRQGAPVGVQWGSDFQSSTVFVPLSYAYDYGLPRQTGCLPAIGGQGTLRQRVTVPIGTQPICQPQLPNIPNPVVEVIRQRVPVTAPVPFEDITNKEQLIEILKALSDARDEIEEDQAAKLQQVIAAVRDESSDLRALLELILILKGQEGIREDIKDVIPLPVPTTPAAINLRSTRLRQVVPAKYHHLLKK